MQFDIKSFFTTKYKRTYEVYHESSRHFKKSWKTNKSYKKYLKQKAVRELLIVTIALYWEHNFPTIIKLNVHYFRLNADCITEAINRFNVLMPDPENVKIFVCPKEELENLATKLKTVRETWVELSESQDEFSGYNGIYCEQKSPLLSLNVKIKDCFQIS